MKFLNAFALASGISALTIPEASSNTLESRQDISKDTKWTLDANFKNGILSRSNDYRRAHGVKQLTWDSTLANYARQYLNKAGSGAGKCPKFEHSGGPYGENLAIGYPSPIDTVSAWGDEREQYDFKKGDFSGATGHFTQLVWASTTKVGCNRKFCNGDNGIRGWYVVCEYTPRGNVLGQFKQQVKQNGYKPPSKKVRSHSGRSLDGQGMSAPPSVFMTSADLDLDFDVFGDDYGDEEEEHDDHE